MQVLTIVLYECRTGSINRHYYHYMLPPGVKNDILAVIACHRLFFQKPLIKQATELSFGNDGGPKHFKLTANLAHMWAFAQTNPGIRTTQHFFVSYHGSGPADAAAQHLKRAIVNETRKFLWLGESLPDIVRRLTEIVDSSTTKCSQVVMPADLNKVLVDTTHGLKQMHKFTFHPNWTVCGWLHSAALAPSNTWQLSFRLNTGIVL